MNRKRAIFALLFLMPQLFTAEIVDLLAGAGFLFNQFLENMVCRFFKENCRLGNCKNRKMSGSLKKIIQQFHKLCIKITTAKKAHFTISISISSPFSLLMKINHRFMNWKKSIFSTKRANFLSLISWLYIALFIITTIHQMLCCLSQQKVGFKIFFWLLENSTEFSDHKSSLFFIPFSFCVSRSTPTKTFHPTTSLTNKNCSSRMKKKHFLGGLWKCKCAADEDWKIWIYRLWII